jgi:CheY-like chemotaxis protein
MAFSLRVRPTHHLSMNYTFTSVRGTHPTLAQQISGYQGERRTLLIVDDNPENRQFLVDLLEPLGFDIIQATNGKEGVEQALAIHPNLILMDLMMPVMNGAVKAIRETPEIKEVPIIAVSSSVFDTDHKKSQIIGYQELLHKPVDSNKLFAMLEKYLAICAGRGLQPRP